MLHYDEFLFRNRETPITVPIAEEEGNKLAELLGNDENQRVDCIEISSLLEHDIWINPENLVLVRFRQSFVDNPPFDPKDLKPSAYFGAGENPPSEEQQYEGDWDVRAWFSGGTVVDFPDCVGHDWVSITCGLQQGVRFVVAPGDGDADHTALNLEQLDMVAGLEVDRYSEEQFEAAVALIR